MKYIKQLDTIRAFAILSVITTHWSPESSIFYNISSTISAPFIFFTISGFLITRILLAERLAAEALNHSKIKVFRNFFIRRALRIFPAYYLLIIVVYLLSNEPISTYFPYLTYTTNIHQSITGTWGTLPHLWTMAVEEQFYLLWPLIILFVPKKHLLHCILLFILAGIISRILLPDNDFILTLPFTCLDALGLGALLSWIDFFRPDKLPRIFKVVTYLGSASICLLVVQILYNHHLYSLNRTLVSIVTVWIITFFLTRQESLNTAGDFLWSNTGLTLIGKISYGMFLYHIPLLAHSDRLFGKFHSLLNLPDYLIRNPHFYVLENFILLVCLSYVSWKFFELPISNFKRYFKNSKRELKIT